MRAVTVAIFLASPAMAEEWAQLDGAAITDALSGQRLVYEGAWQDFHASGRTLYNSGSDSWGTWDVRGDRYCSQWPPSPEWTCYGVSRSGDRIRFTGERGDKTIGTYED